VVLLRKSIPQKYNLKPAAELNVIAKAQWSKNENISCFCNYPNAGWVRVCQRGFKARS
jgi:hypothetical protein